MMRLTTPIAAARLVQTCVFGLCLAAVMAVSSGGASAQAPLESAVKAAYIYRFLEYVTWPGESSKAPTDPIVVAVTREDDVAGELRRIARERTVQNRRIIVLAARQKMEAPVHVLYVPAADIAKFLKGAPGQRPVLIVTDTADGLEHGATINFVHSEGRIKFEVSIDAAQRAGLAISSRLLAIAIRVKKGEYPQHIYAFFEGARAVTERRLRSASLQLAVLNGGTSSRPARLIAPRL